MEAKSLAAGERKNPMILENKVAVVYGAGGGVGGAVARVFAQEGAKVFLTGRRRPGLDAVAQDILAAGGFAEPAEVDALDEAAIDEHLEAVIKKAGRIDISFNAIGAHDTQTFSGGSLIDVKAELFLSPIKALGMSYFFTARLAARRMIPNKSGVIMTVSTLQSRKGVRLVGGYGPAQAVKDALTRNLSAELAPLGIRVVGMRPQAMPEVETTRKAFEPRAKALGMSWEQFEKSLASTTHPQRTMTLAEMANVAAFLASDKASGVTGTNVNLTMGALDD
jgi:NAD(P)-dependent dehydrogenase (short-subunit alcohol dehydrogenase family)